MGAALTTMFKSSPKWGLGFSIFFASSGLIWYEATLAIDRKLRASAEQPATRVDWPAAH